jgi:hypothetical protein
MFAFGSEPQQRQLDALGFDADFLGGFDCPGCRCGQQQATKREQNPLTASGVWNSEWLWLHAADYINISRSV